MLGCVEVLAGAASVIVHFTVSGRLVASDVSKVVDFRTRVKSYFKLFWRKGNEVYKSQ